MPSHRPRPQAVLFIIFLSSVLFSVSLCLRGDLFFVCRRRPRSSSFFFVLFSPSSFSSLRVSASLREKLFPSLMAAAARPLHQVLRFCALLCVSVVISSVCAAPR
jgi:hypothetical protein